MNRLEINASIETQNQKRKKKNNGTRDICLVSFINAIDEPNLCMILHIFQNAEKQKAKMIPPVITNLIKTRYTSIKDKSEMNVLEENE